MRFTQREGRSPTVEVTGVKAEFGAVLTLLKDLAKACDLDRAGKYIDVGSSRSATRCRSRPSPPCASPVPLASWPTTTSGRPLARTATEDPGAATAR